jgi:hypothetical protein
MFKKIGFWIVVLALVGTAIPITTTAEGVDDLRGRWDITISFNPSEVTPPFQLFINDLAPDPAGAPDTYLTSACLASPYGDQITPATVQAVDNGDGTWGLDIYGTLIMMDWATVGRFTGVLEVNTADVDDDVLQGTVVVENGEGTWEATHHDRRRSECPPLEVKPPLYFEPDVNAHHVYNGEVLAWVGTNLDGRTNIVSSAIRVVAPDGTVRDIFYQTDIFTPEVDFITTFHFLGQYDGDPIAGSEYSFTLLDISGNPIEGTTKTDVWMGCKIGVPRDVTAQVVSGNFGPEISISWTPIPTVPGVFDPDQLEVGNYGLESSAPEPSSRYGAVIKLPTHIVPWSPFGDVGEGRPDGSDFGASLYEMVPGIYSLRVHASSISDPDEPGHGSECTTFDYAEDVYFEKAADDTITILP